jgi:hypothetical protein
LEIGGGRGEEGGGVLEEQVEVKEIEETRGDAMTRAKISAADRAFINTCTYGTTQSQNQSQRRVFNKLLRSNSKHKYLEIELTM